MYEENVLNEIKIAENERNLAEMMVVMNMEVE
jgi:hypothetical protein